MLFKKKENLKSQLSIRKNRRILKLKKIFMSQTSNFLDLIKNPEKIKNQNQKQDKSKPIPSTSKEEVIPTILTGV